MELELPTPLGCIIYIYIYMCVRVCKMNIIYEKTISLRIKKVHGFKMFNIKNSLINENYCNNKNKT